MRRNLLGLMVLAALGGMPVEEPPRPYRPEPDPDPPDLGEVPTVSMEAVIASGKLVDEQPDGIRIYEYKGQKYATVPEDHPALEAIQTRGTFSMSSHSISEPDLEAIRNIGRMPVPTPTPPKELLEHHAALENRRLREERATLQARALEEPTGPLPGLPRSHPHNRDIVASMDMSPEAIADFKVGVYGGRLATGPGRQRSPGAKQARAKNKASRKARRKNRKRGK